MYSFSFPDMFTINKTNLVEGSKATLSNIRLLLESEKTGLFGDPYFGTNLHRMLYEQNDSILKDIVIDELYTSIITFIPQVRLQRSGIDLSIRNNKLYATIKCTNVLDNQDQDFTVVLLSEGE